MTYAAARTCTEIHTNGSWTEVITVWRTQHDKLTTAGMSSLEGAGNECKKLCDFKNRFIPWLDWFFVQHVSQSWKINEWSRRGSWPQEKFCGATRASSLNTSVVVHPSARSGEIGEKKPCRPTTQPCNHGLRPQTFVMAWRRLSFCLSRHHDALARVQMLYPAQLACLQVQRVHLHHTFRSRCCTSFSAQQQVKQGYVVDVNYSSGCIHLHHSRGTL